MAFNKTVTLQGDSTAYTISSNVKKYTLKDLGFQETKVGNFSLKRSLDPKSPFNPSIELKVMINSTLDGFKMAAVASKARGKSTCSKWTGRMNSQSSSTI